MGSKGGKEWQKEFDEEFGERLYLVILECVARINNETRTMTREVRIKTYKELLDCEIEAAKNKYYTDAISTPIEAEANANFSINVRQVIPL